MRNKSESVEDQEADKQIAAIIISQMGGFARLSTFVEARNFEVIELGVRFKFSMNPGMDTVEIVLNGMDLYDLDFYNSKEPDKAVKSYRDIYNDQLMDIFEEATGLYLTLNPRG